MKLPEYANVQASYVGAAWLIALAIGLGGASNSCGADNSDAVLPPGHLGGGGSSAKDGGQDAKPEGAAGQIGLGGAGVGGAGVGGGGLGGSLEGGPDTSTGCAVDQDCASTPNTPYCVLAKCEACEQNNPDHQCKNGQGCCGLICQDIQSDLNNCGACGNVCNLPNATASCVGGKCTVAACQTGYENCDLNPENGCEASGACTCPPGAKEDCYSGPQGTQGVGACKAGSRTCNAQGSGWGACEGEVTPQPDACADNLDNDCDGVVNNGYPNAPGCVCLPGSTAPCYSGPAGTEGQGLCHGGTQTCLPEGTGYGECAGEVLPQWEICSNGIDEDCNGTADDSPDADGDGYTVCGGDCCDKAGPVCGSPAVVNPGALEVQGDTVDNNCNGQVDEDPYPPCSTGDNFDTDVSATKALALLNAMELCQVSQNGIWGIIPGSYSLTRANDVGTVIYQQVAITQQFGTDSSNLPKAGANFAVLSSGRARDANDPDATTSATYSYQSGSPPADFVAPHGGQLPQTSPSCTNGSGANDSVRLRVQLKAPANANSFSFQFRFFSQEYWSWTCTQYNDFFIAMLDSTWTPGPGQTAIPADKNICFDSNGGYISVNTTQFFTVCPPKTGYPCPDGTAGLTGTGYTLGPGGSTQWLTTTSPVVPGETITLRFIIWDTSDQALDSLVLIDNFRWSATPSDGPITGQ